MTTNRLIPASETQIQFEVSRSVFIATASPAFSVEEAKAFIATSKEKYSDASHNVPAYIIGHPPNVIEHCNDDGEPSGTAGRPALAVLRGSGFGDIAIVITRYFGGTKLGKGGLVRAYSDAVREVLEVLPAAQKATTTTCQIVIPYANVGTVQYLISNYNGETLDEDYQVDVTFRVKFLDADFEAFQQALREKTSGSVAAQILEHNPDDIIELDGGK
jgi:uncharacterized YigZ family protein